MSGVEPKSSWKVDKCAMHYATSTTKYFAQLRKCTFGFIDVLSHHDGIGYFDIFNVEYFDNILILWQSKNLKFEFFEDSTAWKYRFIMPKYHEQF